MGSFLSVAKGSEEPPVFLEIHYKGSPNASEPPLVFVGKGITFDSGGISIKAAANMDLMRADMGGAATVCSAIVSAAKLDLPINIIGLAPLCENMPSGKANKPGMLLEPGTGRPYRWITPMLRGDLSWPMRSATLTLLTQRSSLMLPP